MKLKDCCIIKTGLVLSRKISDNELDAYKYRQMTLKSVQSDGSVICDEFNDFYSDEIIKENYIAQIGDVILRLTAPFTAIYIGDELEGVVVPSHFVIIKADKKTACPQYITWFLNRDKIKKLMLSSCTGALLQIKPTLISDIDIKLPPLSTQKKVIDINELAMSEFRLYNKLIEQKKQYYKQLTNKISKIK